MAYEIIRTNKEVNEVIDKCNEADNVGQSNYPGMTYEEGIIFMFNWLTDKIAENPFAVKCNRLLDAGLREKKGF